MINCNISPSLSLLQLFGLVWILCGPTSPLYPMLWHEPRPFAALILPIHPVSGRMQMSPPCHRHFTAIDPHAPDSAASSIHHRTDEIPKMASPVYVRPALARELQPSNGILWTYGYGHKSNRMTKRV